MNDLDLFGEPVKPEPAKVVDGAARTKSGSYVVNPLLRPYGPGPEGKRCKHCQHLTQKNDRWFKCDLRAGTFEKSTPVSDHRANWPACGKFQPAE